MKIVGEFRCNHRLITKSMPIGTDWFGCLLWQIATCKEQCNLTRFRPSIQFSFGPKLDYLRCLASFLSSLNSSSLTVSSAKWLHRMRPRTVRTSFWWNRCTRSSQSFAMEDDTISQILLITFRSMRNVAFHLFCLSPLDDDFMTQIQY